MTIRSTTAPFEIVDTTLELSLLPQTWTLLGDSGLFVDEFLSAKTVEFQEITGSLSVLKDMPRGSKPQTTSNDKRKIHAYTVPHFPYMDALLPSDIAGKSAYNNLSEADSEAAAMLRKLTKARKSFDVSREIARFKTIVTGQAYAPNGTVVADYYTDFSLTRNSVDFVFGTATTDIMDKCEEIIAGFQTSANDGVIVTGVTAYCSKAFFTKLLAHAKVQSAYTYYMATEGQSVLRNRAGGAGLYRRFSFGGIDFVEVKTILAGQALVPAGEAYFVANGADDAFVTYYSPPERFGMVNTVAMPEYFWQFRDHRGTEITIEAETNMLNVLRRPNFVAKGTSSN